MPDIQNTPRVDVDLLEKVNPVGRMFPYYDTIASLHTWGLIAICLGTIGTKNSYANALVAAPSHALYLASGNGICAVGDNQYGQLGDGTLLDRRVPVRVLLPDAIDVSTGQNHSLAVTANGQVWAWGANNEGNLGDGTTIPKLVPFPVPSATAAKTVVVGRQHSLVLKSDGTVWAWGYNSYGQLGDGTLTSRTLPVRVIGLTEVVAIAAGEYHNLALKADGTLWAWGENDNGQLGDGTTTTRTSPVRVETLAGIAVIATGYSHSLAIRNDGSVWAWGYNGYGQLGIGSTTAQVSPVRINNFNGVVAISAGVYHSVAARSDGSVWTWGRNESGQLGLGNQTARSSPTRVNQLSGIIRVAAGATFSIASNAGGTVWAWGGNANGQLGNGSTTATSSPVQMSPCIAENGSPVSAAPSGALVAWQSHALRLQAEGRVCAVGDNQYGQLGDGTMATRNKGVFTEAISNARGLATGDTHSLAVAADGRVWAWGANGEGTLGDGTTLHKQTPIIIPGLTEVAAVAAGRYHSMALKTDGTVWSWGYNGDGQLGDGSYTSRYIPTRVVGLSGVIAIMARNRHSLALRSDGTVWTWGSNDNGELGDGTYLSRSSPVQVVGLAGIVAIAAGSDHSLAIQGSDGTVWSWGYNGYGQLGIGSTGSRLPNATRVSDLNGVVAIAGGVSHSVAVKSNGTVWAWGRNEGGQLGDGTTSTRTVPVQVRQITAAVQVGAGATFSTVVTSDGSRWSFGNNNRGQLGNATFTASSTPISTPSCSEEIPSGPYSVSRSDTLAAWQDHSLQAQSGGRVCAAGGNDYGELGDGTLVDRHTPVFSDVTGVVSVATNEYHSLAATSDGRVWAWGANGELNLGDGTTIAKLTPIPVPGIEDVTSVAAGRYHSLALKSDGTVWSWGYNGYGQLGDGTYTNRSVAVRVVGLNNVIAVAARNQHSLALKADGTVWAWGNNDNGELGDGTFERRAAPVPVAGLSGVASIAAGSDHNLAIRSSDGSVWGWGYNGYGQLGNAGTSSSQTNIVRVSELTGVIAIAAGSNHSLAVTSDGTTWAWGRNENGQLGNASTATRTTPVRVLELTKIVLVAAGGAFSIAIDSNGVRWVWGANASGQFGVGTTASSSVPVRGGVCRASQVLPVVTRLDRVIIAASTNHSFGIRGDGNAVAWGQNTYGQLGDGTTVLRRTPVNVERVSSFKSIATKEYHSLGITSAGRVWAWGDNGASQLGDNTTTDRHTPIEVPNFSNAIAVAAGRYHSLALKNDGTVWAWGYNSQGQLGDGSTTSKGSPVQVIGLSDVVAIAAGDYHSAAVKDDGTVWTWGDNNSGELGNGNYTSSTFPVEVRGLSNVIAVAAGAAQNYALRETDGTVWSWGSNGYGQLGNGGTRTSPNVVRVSDLTGVVAISAGSYHGLAVKADGSVWGWGKNDSGQLGDRSATDRRIPVQTDSELLANRVVAVAAGTEHSLALRDDGRLYAWGANDSGQFATPPPPPSSTVPYPAGEGFFACFCLTPLAPETPAVVSSIFPNSTVRGTASLAVTIRGQGFVPDSVARWNQSALVTVFVSPTELRATVTQPLLSSAGRANLIVASPSGVLSNPLAFLVTDPEPPPPANEMSADAVSIEPKILNYPNASEESNSGSQSDLFRIKNNGSSSLRYEARVETGSEWLSLVDPNNQLSISSISGSIPTGLEVRISVRTNFPVLGAARKDGIVTVSYGDNLEHSSQINVTAGPVDKPNILLSRSVIQDRVTREDFLRRDNPILAYEFFILNLGNAPLQWKATTNAPWLSVSPGFSPETGLPPFFSNDPEHERVKSVLIRVDKEELKNFEFPRFDTEPGAHSAEAEIIIEAPNTMSKRIRFQFGVVPNKATIEAIARPTGFLFSGDVGTTLEAKTLTVQSRADRQLAFQLQPTLRWRALFEDTCFGDCVFLLSRHTPTTFQIRPKNLDPADEEVTTPRLVQMPVTFDVSPSTSLPPELGGNWTIEGLVVRRRPTAQQLALMPDAGRNAGEACVPQSLHIVSASLPNVFFLERTKVQDIDLKIADNCGQLLEKGWVVAVPSNGDPAIRFRPAGEGTWQGTWQPGRAGRTRVESVSLDIVASSPDGASGRRAIEGTVVPTATPVPTTPVVVSAASFQHENVLTPGAMVSVFGTDFVESSNLFQAGSLPAPLTLGGASVWLDSRRLPLLSAGRLPATESYAEFDFINVLVPFDISVGDSLTLFVERADGRSAPVEVIVAAARPGIFLIDPFAAALDGNYRLVAAENRVERGQMVQLFATGLGMVSSPPAAGHAAGHEPLSSVTGNVRVFFNDVEQLPAFAGLAPGFYGLYQVNVLVPPAVAPMNGIVEVVIEVEGVRSAPLKLPVI